MKKALMIASVLLIAVISTACINNIAVQELNNKAAEFMQKGDYNAAMNRLQASLDLDSTLYETHYNLGVAAVNSYKYDVAIEALENSIKLNPNHADSYYTLALAQSGLAEELLADRTEFDDDDKATTNKNNKNDVVEFSKEDMEKYKNLRTSAVENLKKYIELNPNKKEEESIIDLIADLEKPVEKNSKNVLIKVED